MKFCIDNEIFARFPELNLGVVIARGINNSGEIQDIQLLLRDVQQNIRESHALETLSQDPRIQAWRKAYSEFGAKPKKYKSSVESLYRMTLKEIPIRSINPVVDLYNVISLKHMVPVGGDDLDKVDGDIQLLFALGSEPFVPLNAETSETAKPGEVIYRDDVEVLCRRWNWRECDKTKMSEDTHNMTLVVEGLPPIGNIQVEDIITELAEMVKRFCEGETQLHILNKQNPDKEIF